jgi:regulation of enolase protein 1 (concanavalin A-like superfamily)
MASVAPPFDGEEPLGADLSWFSPPPTPATASGGVLTVRPGAGTDFWSNTFYGFPDPQPHNGHVLHARQAGDFVAEVTVAAAPVHRYDQAGLMVRVDEGCWLKCSVEFIPDGPSHLGSVVTNGGWSDWATQDVPSGAAGPPEYAFRVRRLGADFIVDARAVPGGGAAPPPWSQIRMAHLAGAEGEGGAAPVQVGLYACSPLGAGFAAHFRAFSITPGRLPQDVKKAAAAAAAEAGETSAAAAAAAATPA